jgi:hypothetical protein
VQCRQLSDDLSTTSSSKGHRRSCQGEFFDMMVEVNKVAGDSSCTTALDASFYERPLEPTQHHHQLDSMGDSHCSMFTAAAGELDTAMLICNYTPHRQKEATQPERSHR